MDPADLYENLKDDNNILIINTRSEKAYKQEHIPGAISFPHRTMNENSASKLDKDTLYVIYCDGIGCNASTKGALNLTKLGFNVQELIVGMENGYKTEGHNSSTKQSKAGCNC